MKAGQGRVPAKRHSWAQASCGGNQDAGKWTTIENKPPDSKVWTQFLILLWKSLHFPGSSEAERSQVGKRSVLVYPTFLFVGLLSVQTWFRRIKNANFPDLIVTSSNILFSPCQDNRVKSFQNHKEPMFMSSWRLIHAIINPIVFFFQRR